MSIEGLGFWLIRAMGRTLPARVRLWVAWHVGKSSSGWHRRSRRAVAQNLVYITGQPASLVAPLVKRVGGHFACYLVDFLCSDELERSRLTTLVGEVPRALFERVVPRGRGAMVVTAHLGHWEFGAELIARWGYPVTVIYQPHRSRLVERLFSAARSSRIRWVPVGPQAARAAWRALEAGEVVATAADRLYGDAGIRVSLCGRAVWIPRGPFALAVRAKVPLVCAFVLRTDNGGYAGVVEPPQVPSGKDPAAVQALAQGFAALLERYLRRYPDQWYVFDPFWNARSVG